MISVVIQGKTKMLLSIYIISSYNQRAMFILEKIKEISGDSFIFQTCNSIRTETTDYKIEVYDNNLFKKLRGQYIDQIILDDEFLSSSEINNIKEYIAQMSCVPEEFQIIDAKEILRIIKEEPV